MAAIGLALSFEFVNGFHDTANAVATVIYTHSLPAWIAVVWSGLWNLTGVLLSPGTVAFSILALLPVELVLNVGSSAGFAMVFALLISAIMWNLGTWYLGLPASSSHTLIGSIMGVGLANSLMTAGQTFGEGVNWAKVHEVFASLLISPIIGFCFSAALLLLAKLLLRNPALYKAPPKDQPPPWPIRLLLICTCTGVSFAHGSNDGQKGMGLILLILIGILPGMYAINATDDAKQMQQLQASAISVENKLTAQGASVAMSADEASKDLSGYLKTTGKFGPDTLTATASINHQILSALSGKATLRAIPESDRRQLRTDLYLVAGSIEKLNKQSKLGADAAALAAYQQQLNGITKFIPDWVKVAVAIALGLGTMIGWKRIVKTVGEKIGKEHLTYAQGASAELVAMGTIGLADHFGLPVSTTHVLSSGVAGTMAANHSGLQMATLRNILMAWVLTLPVCVLLGSATFAAGLFIIFHTSVSLLIAAAALILASYACWRWGIVGKIRGHMAHMADVKPEAGQPAPTGTTA
jgi:PiT family inorganic phosphate transporter